ncbi:hypothetical protein ACTWP5_15055 [Streptomyces sp. 4N509B]|uniref:hypothetical protein n=1 Tax=Streptomyces sp. 4N509B TaxID=3457413 RepID=UPI003FD460DA
MPASASPDIASMADPTRDPATTGPLPTVRRSRGRRARESAFGALLLSRLAFTGLLVVLLLVAGVRASWETAQHAMVAEGRERGTMTLLECDDERCVGPFAPEAGESGTPRAEVVLPETLGRDPGDELSVALRPGTNEAVRTGLSGILYAWLPLTGALLLAGIVTAGGLRMYRIGWATAGVGLAALTVTFALW